MSYRQRLSCVTVMIAVVPSICFGQAAAVIVAPMVVADGPWIKRQCDCLRSSVMSNDAAAAALQTAKEACDRYDASPGNEADRDAWVRSLMALQDDVGPMAMREFVPRIGGLLPSGLDSYSLFLFPDESYRTGELVDETRSILEMFYSFGRSIGDRHAAIWFEDQEGNVDVDRSRTYCRRLELDPNDGPYIVIFGDRPDIVEPGDPALFIRLGGISPNRIMAVLNHLITDLEEGGVAELRTRTLVFEEVSRRFITSLERFPEGPVATFLGTILPWF